MLQKRAQRLRVLEAKPRRLYLPQLYVKSTARVLFTRAGVQGLEPRYSGPKPDVLPLDDTPMCIGHEKHGLFVANTIAYMFMFFSSLLSCVPMPYFSYSSLYTEGLRCLLE